MKKGEFEINLKSFIILSSLLCATCSKALLLSSYLNKYIQELFLFSGVKSFPMYRLNL